MPKERDRMSRGKMDPCPLCDAEPIKVSLHPGRDAFDIECRRCGPFTVSGTLYADRLAGSIERGIDALADELLRAIKA